ncbi:DoxX family membrane protein [Saccharothrix hoggarensis]|uniref:DoxX family membrane protein n=1 Tax=Saccharothrix hoggarensis TaxID=913853 RepID=A0ABW3QVG6_9PSEU
MTARLGERTIPWRHLDRVAPPALRISIGVVFVWFGVLKVTGDSPVAHLVGAAVPWVDQGFLVPALGWFEVALGVALLIGRLPRLTLVVVAAHLAGTFLVFVQAPALVMTGGNPLLLTTNGEFVLKNVVLICAALVLLGRVEERRTG